MLINKAKYINLITSFLLVVITTDAYRLFSAYSSLSNSLTLLLVIIPLTIFTTGCLRKSDLIYASKKQVLVVFFSLFMYPIILNLMFLVATGDSAGIYWITKNIQFLIVFLLIYFNYDRLNSRKIYNYICIVIGLSFLINTFQPDIIRMIGITYAVNLSYVEYGTFNNRMVGFFLHPNSASLSILMLLLIGLILRFISIFHLVFFTIIILSTGSRTGLALFFIICMAWLFEYLRQSKFFLNHKNYSLRLVVISLLVFSLIPIALMFFYIILPPELLNRYEVAILGENDQSLLIRQLAQKQYLNYFLNSPVIGHGTSFIRAMIDNAVLVKPSHNIYIERSVQFGLLGLFIYLYMLIKLSISGNSFLERLSIFILFVYGFFISSFDQNLMYFTFLAVYTRKVLYEDTSDTACN